MKQWIAIGDSNKHLFLELLDKKYQELRDTFESRFSQKLVFSKEKPDVELTLKISVFEPESVRMPAELYEAKPIDE